MTKISVWSVDAGYGYNKMDRKGTPEQMSSAMSLFKPKPPVEDIQAANPITRPKYFAFKVDNRRHILGDYVPILDPNLTWVGGENKIYTPDYPIMLKGLFGHMCSGPTEQVDVLLMNLPADQCNKANIDQLTRYAKGTHEVEVSDDGVNFVRKVIRIQDVVVKKQGFGSLCHVMLDGQGGVQDYEFGTGFKVIVDIGARTVNYLTYDGLSEIDSLTQQTNNGMFASYLEIGKYLKDELNKSYPTGKLPIIVQSRKAGNDDISSIVDYYLQNHANTIFAELDTLLANSLGFVQHIVFTGGGTEALQEHFKGMVTPYESRGIKVHYLNKFANVQGLRKYGLKNANKYIKRPEGIVARIGQNEY
jgi:plasmid segregation protein ParM